MFNSSKDEQGSDWKDISREKIVGPGTPGPKVKA